MSQAKIKVKITPEGSTEIEVEGMPGMSCTDLTELLVNGLGELEEQTLTAEAYESDLPDYVSNLDG